MLGSTNAMATVAVRDVDVASKFYEDTLGLERESAEGSEAITYKAGGSRVLVYRSQYAGTNEATAVTWAVEGDLDGVVRALRAKSVVFEHYNMPGTTRKGDVHETGGVRVAWFKDPDGNIHALVG
jgi:catechol 2,3-dioxygenase-like lactoylglutathione lyase family enzyme